MKFLHSRIKYIYLFLILFFCSNRCAPELTLIHFYNKSGTDVIVLSKDETKNSEVEFLSKDLVKDRTIKNNNDLYLGFDNFELNNFKNKEGNFIFYVKKLEKNSKFDSIIINNKKISLLKQENTIVFEREKLYFLNKN